MGDTRQKGLQLAAAFTIAVLVSAAGIDGQTLHVRSGVELVPLAVTVRGGVPGDVAHLQRDDFDLYENGRRQTIALFDRARPAIILGVLFDSSRSMRADLEEAKSAIHGLLDVLQPGDVGFIVDAAASIQQPVTGDVTLLRARLGRVAATDTTALYDSISLADHVAAEHRRTAPQSQFLSVIAVVSDGADTSSTTMADVLLARMRANGTLVYALRPRCRASAASGRIARHLDREHARMLRYIAESTGGRLFDAPRRSDYSDIRRHIEQGLPPVYLMAYSPTGVGTDADVTVRLKRRRLTVHATRTGPSATLGGLSH